MENEWIKSGVTIYQNDMMNWNIALGAIVCFILYVIYVKKADEWYNHLPRRRGKAMRRSRRDFVRQDAIDALVNHIEERVYQGEYSREEAKELYRDAKKVWPIRDLFPSPERLKEDIRRRLLVLKDTGPVPLPGRAEKPKRLHIFDKTAKA